MKPMLTKIFLTKNAIYEGMGKKYKSFISKILDGQLSKYKQERIVNGRKRNVWSATLTGVIAIKIENKKIPAEWLSKREFLSNLDPESRKEFKIFIKKYPEIKKSLTKKFFISVGSDKKTLRYHESLINLTIYFTWENYLEDAGVDKLISENMLNWFDESGFENMFFVSRLFRVIRLIHIDAPECIIKSEIDSLTNWAEKYDDQDGTPKEGFKLFKKEYPKFF